jgi:hypothetical protein
MNEQRAAQVILRIYANFKWKLKIADRSAEEVNRLIDEAIIEISALVPPDYRAGAIQKFEQMKNRLSEFVVDGVFQLPESPTPIPIIGLGKPNPCKCGNGDLELVKRRGNPDEEFAVRCDKCKVVGLFSENPHIALENWNNGMVD